MRSLKDVAEAICKADGHNPDYVTWKDYTDHAKAALWALIDTESDDPVDVAVNRRINEVIYNSKKGR